MSWKGRGKEEERGSFERNLEEGIERKELGGEEEVGALGRVGGGVGEGGEGEVGALGRMGGGVGEGKEREEGGSWNSERGGEEEEKEERESSDVAGFSSSDFRVVRGEERGERGEEKVGEKGGGCVGLGPSPSWPLWFFCWCLYLNFRMISEGYWATKRLQGSMA